MIRRIRPGTLPFCGGIRMEKGVYDQQQNSHFGLKVELDLPHA